MAIERFTVVALPHSKAKDAPFHVSLFIAPQLTPDADEGRLDEFKHFTDWAHAVTTGTIELADQAGTIDADPLLDVIDPAAWARVFPPDTPVRSPVPPDWDDRHWRTFDAATVHDAGKALGVLPVFTSPTSPPLPTAHPVGRVMNQWFSSQDGSWDESVITRILDAQLGEGDGRGGPPLEITPLDAIEERLSGADPLTKLIHEVHRARRFYERPESALPYQERPSDDPVVEEVPRPDPDFHERCTFVSDHPALQRRLGLVIDLRVHDLSRLAHSEYLTASITLGRDPGICRTVHTRCRAVGDDLVTIDRSGEWHDGALRLGDTETFAVLDMDADGTALKLDRFLWSLPRLIQIEQDGGPAQAAPPALRSLGFTVARRLKALETRQRMDRQREIAGRIDDTRKRLLDTEDVTQGMRVEVWDEITQTWYSLHSRRIHAAIHNGPPVVKDLAEEGFVQGTTATETVGATDSPVHVHEAMFGWDGWSLAAPRPGKRVRHEDGEEVVEDTDVDPRPITPLIVTNRVEPGTLPRLRYGRSYALRVWAVDLAGNSRPHQLGPTPPADEPTLSAVRAMLGTTPPAADPQLVAVLRGAAAAQIVEARSLLDNAPGEIHYDTLLPDLVLRQVRQRRTSGPVGRAAVSRADLVGRAFADAVLNEQAPYLTSTAVFDPRTVMRPELDLPTADEAATVSPLRPFLRWHPVPPPVVVARHPFTAGESLRQVVIRSGVEQDRETLEITVTPPETYAAAFERHGYRPSSDRHLVPPKASQSEAELHGAFDSAIGSTNTDRHKALLAVALREAGTLFDVDVPRLDDPHTRDPQPEIDLASEPSVPESERKTLPLPPGEPPAPGQYVVHDVDELAVPYLPDVAARGISLVFPEAGRDRTLLFPFGTEGFTATYRGGWPTTRPFRLRLHGSEMLDGRLVGGELRIGLPPGDVQRFRLASSLDPSDLDLFGLWRLLPEILRTNPDIAEAAADGWLWALTPFDEVTLVHAVPRPLEAPRPTVLTPSRPGEGSTDVVFAGAVDLHGPSTEQLSAEASWTDPVDDLSHPGPSEQRHAAVAFTTRIHEDEDIAVLAPAPEPSAQPTPPLQDVKVEVPGFGPVWIHRVRHLLGDTRHHLVDYQFRASTRFREYFDADAVVAGPDDPELPTDDGQSVVGPVTTLSIPSSARPAAPIVHSVIPLLRWDEGTEPEQPVALRRRRQAGVRIYLERPWYSSGRGELLAVLLAPRGNDSDLGQLVSQWGADPVWVGQQVSNRAMFLELDNLMRTIGLDDRPGDARPVTGPTNLPLPRAGRPAEVVVLGYEPQYNESRQLWYVDVAIDPASTFWPFVRLSVARYQPDSIDGCHLSPPVQCDFVQLTPERTASVSRTDIRHVRVVVSGPVGVRPRLFDPLPGPFFAEFRYTPAELADLVRTNRLMVARLQRRDPDIPTDLGWRTVAVTELEVKGTGKNAAEAAWVGSLTSPVNIPLRRPGDTSNWRVGIEEWEALPGDPPDLSKPRERPVWERRLVYADFVPL